LLITLGAADQPDQPVRTIIDGYMIGFSRRSFQTVGALVSGC
jgi:4,5-DOPA dioxygenase extradiol